VPEPPDEQKREALGLSLRWRQTEMPVQAREIAEYNRERQAKIDELKTMTVPAENEEEIDLGPAWHTIVERERDAIIQSPPPEIPPAPKVAEAVAERDGGEAGE
jgi:hypothetical protein